MIDESVVNPGEPEEGPGNPEPNDLKAKTTAKLAALMNGGEAKNDDSEDEVKTGTAVKLRTVLDQLREAKGKEANIAGLKIVDTKKALANLEAFLKHMGKFFSFSKDDTYFQRFSGYIVGESRQGGTHFDPILLMHPLARFVRTGFHEYGHDKDRIQPEGMLDAQAEVKAKKCGLIDEDSQLTEKYEQAKVDFYTFVERVREGKTVDDTVEEVFQLYYNNEFEKVYELYEEKYINKLPEEDRDEAFKFFNVVFPELEVKGDGQYHPLVEEVGPEIEPEYMDAA